MVKLITQSRINKHLKSKKKVKSLLFTTSTNDILKNLILKGKDCDAVVSEMQFKGRGRIQRKFHSPSFSGIYITVRLKKSFDFFDVGKITTCVAVMVCRTIESLYAVQTNVKWVNDVFVGGKKVAGVLAESVIVNNKIKDVLIGIGINVYDKKFPTKLMDIATNLEKESGKKIDRNKIIALLLENLDKISCEIKKDDFIEEYKSKMFLLNKKVMVISGNESFDAICKDVTCDGKLIVEKDGKEIEISVGDVSVKAFNNNN